MLHTWRVQQMYSQIHLHWQSGYLLFWCSLLPLLSTCNPLTMQFDGMKGYVVQDAHCVGEANVLSTPSFMHSPWQEELLALQSRVSQQTTNREAKEAARALKRQSRREQQPGSIGNRVFLTHQATILLQLSC